MLKTKPTKSNVPVSRLSNKLFFSSVYGEEIFRRFAEVSGQPLNPEP
jgi:hypothetical protein